MLRKVFTVMIVSCVLWMLICLAYFNISGVHVYSVKLFVLHQQWNNYTIDEKMNVSLSTENLWTETKTLPVLETCPETPPKLVGPLAVDFNQPMTLDSVRRENPDLQDGGRFKPQDCIARQKVAVIVPFRNRTHHLKYWLYYLHPILQRQQLDYGIYIINQHGNGTFNRAKLMNVGYFEALKEYDYDCFVFNDVDLIPIDDRNIYKCFSQPRHLSASVDTLNFWLPHENSFGGVTSLSKQQFLEINGFPNRFWGWGGEDDEIAKRIKFRGMSLSRPDQIIGRYMMIRHLRDFANQPNKKRLDLVAEMDVNGGKMDEDGINSLEYNVVKTEKNKLLAFITVDVGSPISIADSNI